MRSDSSFSVPPKRNTYSRLSSRVESVNLFRNSPQPSNGSFCAPFFCMVFAYSIEYVKNRTKKICTKISYLLTTGNFERGSFLSWSIMVSTIPLFRNNSLSIKGISLFFIFERSLVINCTPHSRNFSAKSAISVHLCVLCALCGKNKNIEFHHRAHRVDP